MDCAYQGRTERLWILPSCGQTKNSFEENVCPQDLDSRQERIPLGTPAHRLHKCANNTNTQKKT